ncbi:MAG TPA: ABC transporter permease [Hyphomicrobiaceae bacterium]|nr:ABC transporter permease [Hyphomicrobiaceae bacterium]
MSAPLAATGNGGGNRRLRILLQRCALLALLVGLWWIAGIASPPYVFPRPDVVLARIIELLQSGDLIRNLLTTLGRVSAGFAIAVLIGVPVGILLGSNRTVGEFFEPILPVMNTVSSAIWAIFAIMWFGLSPLTPIFVVVMTALPLIATNVWQGTQAVNADFVELAHALRFSRIKTLAKIYVPSILPYFFSGARLAFGFGWRVSLVAETLGSASGVGYRLKQASDLIQIDQVFAWTVVQIVMMLAIEVALLKPVERYFFRWRRDVRG